MADEEVGQEPELLPPTFPLDAIPTRMMAGIADMKDGSTTVLLRFVVACGDLVFVATPDQADAFADEVKAKAAQARSGLQIARTVPTNGGVKR